MAWECTGSTLALHEAIRVVRRKGLVVAAGFYQGKAADCSWATSSITTGSASCAGRSATSTRPSPGTPSARGSPSSTLAGRVKLGTLPRLTLPVEEAAAAFAALGDPAKVLQTGFRYDA